MLGPEPIFDAARLRRGLKRAEANGSADFLLVRTSEDVIERLATVKRDFTNIADIGTPLPVLVNALGTRWPGAQMARVAPFCSRTHASREIVGDPERLPLKDGSCDLAVSALALQAVNDLPGALVQIRRALRPDGLFLGALLGGRTLHELRTVLTEAESAETGGASPRVAPFADVRDLGGLLQRAGFALPVADSETLTVRYDTIFALMADLRAMGAANALVARARRPTRRAIFLRAAALYRDRFADTDGRIRATFEILSVSGWAPHTGQAKPARRGSGQISLATALSDRSSAPSKK